MKKNTQVEHAVFEELFGQQLTTKERGYGDCIPAWALPPPRFFFNSKDNPLMVAYAKGEIMVESHNVRNDNSTQASLK